MNKKEAAQVLNKSPRTIAEYVSTGRLKCTYIAGKTGQEAFFQETDVAALKAELETPTHRAVVVSSENGLLVERGNNQEVASRVMEALLQRLSQVKTGPRELLLTEIDVKPILKLTEVQRLTGLPRSLLLAAIKDKRLKADNSRWGRGWRMRRADLNVFISKT